MGSRSPHNKTHRRSRSRSRTRTSRNRNINAMAHLIDMLGLGEYQKNEYLSNNEKRKFQEKREKYLKLALTK